MMKMRRFGGQLIRSSVRASVRSSSLVPMSYAGRGRICCTRLFLLLIVVTHPLTFISRFLEEIGYILPPFVFGYLVYNWAKKNHAYRNTKAGMIEYGEVIQVAVFTMYIDRTTYYPYSLSSYLERYLPDLDKILD